jgi:dolichol-phosphate mannosyltransferase
MLKLALDGITSLSFKPLVISAYFGGVTLAAGMISFIADVITCAVSGSTILNLGLLLSLNLVLFGLLFCFVGIMGQYIGRIFDESKARPLYIIESQIACKNSEIRSKIS